MNQKYLIEALNHLGKIHFNRAWPEESIKVIASEVDDISDRGLAAAVKRAMVEISPSMFPSLKRMVELMREEQIKINLSNSAPDAPSRQYNDAHPVIDRKTIGSMGIDSLRLIDGLLDGKLTKENFIEGMMVFDKKYPRCDWSDQAGKLAAHYSRQEREENARYADA